MRDRGIGSWTARRARMSPNRIAATHEERDMTYATLHERAARVAQALRAAGVGHGDRVAYIGANHPAFLEMLFGTAQLGAIFVPLSWRLEIPELAAIVADCTPRVLVAGPGEAARGEQLGKTGIQVWTVDAPAYEERLRVAPATFPDEDVDVDEACLILYTSGTTGTPKGAVLSHANLAWNTFNLLVDVDLGTDEVTLVAAPMFHVAALNQTVLPTFLKGGRSILVSAFDPVAALRLIERYRVTFLFGVPTMFLAMAQSPAWAGADLSSVRSALCGGAPVPEALLHAYHDRGVTMLQGYGLTEASAGVTFLRREDALRKVGSAGTACFFTDVRVVDFAGAKAGPGEPGEIQVQGPNVMHGYWNRPDATGDVLRDGWLSTGDVAIRDEEGYLYVRDRIKDMFISGGENVYPAEVEDVLYQHPAVAECAVIGVPDPYWGEVGRAIVVLRPETSVDPDELLAFMSGRIARFKAPKSVVIATALPKTASGKLQRRLIRDRYRTVPGKEKE